MKLLAKWYLLLTGWRFVGELPNHRKMVMVGYPHTSNWDFVVFLGALSHFGVKMNFLMKEGVFKWPFSILFEWWGGVRVGDTRGTSLVSDAVRAFDERDDLILAIAPEGTRVAAKWRSGFWRIADAADVPVLLAFVDRSTKSIGFGPAFKVDGDIDAWMAQAREFYADKHGWKPANVGPIEF